MRRYDFATEEEYEKYKSTMEANPKAAFQYGVKSGEGRKSQKQLENRGKQKLANELQKIERIFDDKGFGNKGAFEKEPTPKRVPQAEDPNLKYGSKKRQRI